MPIVQSLSQIGNFEFFYLVNEPTNSNVSFKNMEFRSLELVLVISYSLTIFDNLFIFRLFLIAKQIIKPMIVIETIEITVIRIRLLIMVFI
jgi:hypothetical protein